MEGEMIHHQKDAFEEHVKTPAEDGEDYGYRPKLVWNAGVEQYLSDAYGQLRFAEICQALTNPSITSTVRVNTLLTSTMEVMAELRQHFQAPSPDREAVFPGRESTFDSSGEALNDVRAESVYDTEVEGGVGKSEDQLENLERRNGFLQNEMCWEHPVLKDVVMVRGHGPCNVECRNGTTDQPLVKEVVVSRKCAEAVLRGAQVFVPGVLSCSLHVAKGDEVAVTVAVEKPDSSGGWSVGITRGTTLESVHAKAQLKGSNRSDLFIGMGRVTMSRAAIFKASEGVAVEMTRRVFDLPPFHGLLRGHIFLQNLPSIVATRVLDPKPGDRILDMCAAPGGKTTAIAILMKDEGEIIALDRSHNKVLEIKRLSEEMKLTSIQAYKMDATKIVQVEKNASKEVDPVKSAPLCQIEDISGSKESVLEISSAVRSQEDVHHGRRARDTDLANKGAYKSDAAARKQARKMKNMLKRGQVDGKLVLKGFELQSFDRVLLDAPCSALGLRPRLFAGEETLEGLRSHACYQRKMLDQAVKLVRPNGTLVYSTCTLNPGENEAVVRYALDTYDFLSLVPQEPRVGGPGLVGGLGCFDGMSFKEWLREDEKDLVQRFCPTEVYDTIGFFIAKFTVASKEGQFLNSCSSFSKVSP